MGAYRLRDLDEGLDDALAHLGPEDDGHVDESEPDVVVAPTPNERETRFGRLSWDDLDLPGPEHEYIIDGWLTVGDKSIIGGPSKSGKSFFAIHAGMCLATGRAFFGADVQEGLVIYQAGEGARGIKKRLRAWRQEFEAPKAGLPFELLQSKIDLYNKEGDTGPLIETCRRIHAEWQAKRPGIALVALFIDTLATATGGADENSGKDMGTVLANIARIESELGCHVCLVHHLNAAGTKLRGHTSIFANIDNVVFVTRDETTKIRTAILDKQKDDEDGVKLRFELRKLDLGANAKGKPVSSCVCLPVGAKQAHEAKRGVPISPKEVVFMRALMNARKERGYYAGADQIAAGAPEDVLIVNYADWRDAYAAVCTPEGDGAAPSFDTIRKAFERANRWLIRSEIIGWHRPFLWWTGKPVRDLEETLPEPDALRTDPGHEPTSIEAYERDYEPF